MGWRRGWFDTYAGRVVAQRGQCRVFEGPAWSRNTHRRHPQHDGGAVRVIFAPGPHPSDPPAQAPGRRSPETDALRLQFPVVSSHRT